MQGGDTPTKIEAGLPNIIGSTTGNAESSTNPAPTGAFYPSSEKYYCHTFYGTGNYPRQQFDASKSNPIYGHSNTVQPSSIVLVPQIRF